MNMRDQQRAQKAKKKHRKTAQAVEQFIETFLQHRFYVAEPLGCDDPGHHFIVDKRGKKVDKFPRDLMAQVAAQPLPWYIVAYAICKDQQGNQYIKELDGMQLPEGMTYQQSAGQISQIIHDSVKKHTNPQHFVGAGWIASLTGQVLDPEVAFEVLAMHGIYDKYVAYWEGTREPEKLVS